MKFKTYKAYSYKSLSSPGKMYTTLLLENGEITCNCPGWTRRVGDDGTRTCKHCDDVKTKKDYTVVRKMMEEEGSRLDIKELDIGLVDSLGVKSGMADRAEKLFGILREYGYLCFRNYYHKRSTALKSLVVAINARTEKGIPVSGCLWIDRKCTKDVDSDVDSFKINVYIPDGNRGIVIFGEISEAAKRCQLEVTIDVKEIASFGFVVLHKVETLLPF